MLIVAWSVIGLYTLCVVLLHVPAVQHFVACKTADTIAEKVGTKVNIGNVSLGFLTRIIIDDVTIDDQRGKQMLKCGRLSAKIDISELLRGEFVISSAQIFSMKADISRSGSDKPLNCQFLIDSLSSGKKSGDSRFSLEISSLIIRNTALSYNKTDETVRPNRFDPNHVNIENLSSHIILHRMSGDTLSLRMKRLSFTETNSRLKVNDISFAAHLGKTSADVKNFNLQTDCSDISIDVTAKKSGSRFTALSLQSHHSALSANDIAAFIPQLRGLDKTFFIDADIKADTNHIDMKELLVKSSGRSLSLAMTGTCRTVTDIFSSMPARLSQVPDWHLALNSLDMDAAFIHDILKAFGTDAALLRNLGRIRLDAALSSRRNIIRGDAQLITAAGGIYAEVACRDNKLGMRLATRGPLNLGQIIGTTYTGRVDATLDAEAAFDEEGGNLHSVNARIAVPDLSMNNRDFSDIKAELNSTKAKTTLTATIDDRNLNARIDLEASNLLTILNKGINGNATFSVTDIKDVTARGEINHINPWALNITDKYGPAASFSFHTSASVGSLSSPLDNLHLNIGNLFMQNTKEPFFCHNIDAVSTVQPDGRRLTSVTSDFCDIKAEGYFSWKSLGQTLSNVITDKTPHLLATPSRRHTTDNISIEAEIRSTSFLRSLADINIHNGSPIMLKAYVNGASNAASVSFSAPALQLSGTKLNNSDIHLYTRCDTLLLDARTTRQDDKARNMSLSLAASASHNSLNTSLRWATDNRSDFRGVLNCNSIFSKSPDGERTAHISVQPSEMYIQDTLWHIRPSRIMIGQKDITVDNFLIEHDKQHIAIDGRLRQNASDSLVLNLSDINVAYIMNLINFHSVDFAGDASGTAVVKKPFSKLQAEARLTVSNFLFEQGRMGTLSVSAGWDNQSGQINLEGQCLDPDVIPENGEEKDRTYPGTAATTPRKNWGVTDVKGYVSIKKNYIDLDIKARNTRAEFLQTFCSSFLDSVAVHTTGDLRLWGDLSEISLTGTAVANGKVFVTPLGTAYTLRDDTVSLVHNDIRFARCKVYDSNGNYGIVNGAIHHQYLSRMTYDINVQAEHLHCYEQPIGYGESFGGHVIGSGTCKITGRPGEIVFDIEAYPEKGSEIVYNISSPETLQNQEFITWRTTARETDILQDRENDGRTADRQDGTGSLLTDGMPAEDNGTDVVSRKTETAATTTADDDFTTNIHLNFLIHASTANTLRLIMDERTGDYITLRGNGTMRANYYNKGGMQIYGNYNVEQGEYKMTIQKVITKSFEFMPGGKIAFGGDPYDATVNLQAQYVVPSVPLSDLSIGNSFSKNNVRVNCLMNITGTAEHPVVDFDLALPQASPDVQQMITSVMDSEQRRTQQVLYLLSVGRFYAGDNTANGNYSQASLAMQSFLSGTVSQQLNNIISDVVLKSNNWNFGANISPGDEGMMNAEYEGIISGSMFNNRLLVNGQFGYRDNTNATTSFIGDFDIRYLLFPNGNLQVKVYNQTSDRYFTKSNLNTQGFGIIFKHDFTNFLPGFMRRKKYMEPKKTTDTR